MRKSITKIRVSGKGCGLLLVWVLFSGCTSFTPEGRHTLMKGYQAYQRKDDAETIRRMTRFLEKFGSTQEAAEGYYLRGLAYVRTGKPSVAEKDFTRCARQAIRADLQRYARVSLGNLAFEEEKFSEAAKHYRASLPSRPNQDPYGRVLARLAVALQGAGRWTEADVFWARILYYFKNSPTEQFARQRFRSNCFMVQTGAFGNPANALAQREKLKQHGFPARRQRRYRVGRLLTVNQVGPYETWVQGVSALKKVRRFVPGAVLRPARRDG